MRTILTLLVVVFAITTGCTRSARYDLHGQVIAIDRGRHELTVKHDDVRGFMPAMTMPFKVEDDKYFEGLQPGDLITATLVVRESTGFLTAIRRTGHAAVTEPPPVTMNILDPGEPVPALDYIDETGAAHSLAEWRGRVLAVTFIYTRCPLPDFCPRMDRNFKQVQSDVLSDPALRDRIGLLSISFDPTFDTPPVLAAHAKRVGADPRIWHFATGDRPSIEMFARRFGVSVIRDAADGGTITHNLRTAVIGSDGTLLRMLNGNDWTPLDLMTALRQAH